MSAQFVITGTDTDIGKTVFAAALTHALDAHYWKPIQSGLAGESDSAAIMRLARRPADRILPEAWRLKEPASPHYAAALQGKTIDPDSLRLPDHSGPLVIEGAGGALVPVNSDLLYADLFARWALPVVIVARTRLGTINHSLMTIEALRSRGVTIHGIAFVGDAMEDSEATICAMGAVKRLGRLPILDPLTPGKLHDAFAAHFRMADFV
jgi:dethiobiotin synthetase